LKEAGINPRELVVDMLMEIYAEKEYSHILIRNVLDKYEYLKESDRAFIKKVTEGTLERGIQIDYILNSYSKVKVNKMKPFIRSLMRMSVYQILFLSKVPDSAVCNEAVKLAQKRNFGPLKGFVNGVLRTISRQKEEIAYPDEKKDPMHYISVKYSLPEELAKLLIKQHGIELTRKMGEAFLQDRKLCVRVGEFLSKEEKEEVLQEWENAGVSAHKHPWLPYAYELEKTEKLTSLTGFNKGLYTVQDISSMLVCQVAGIKKGDYCIDVCSAPGGKALHACDKLQHTGTVDARDVSTYKTDMILENKARMGADNLMVKVWDATCKDEEAVGKADVLLVDAPCSGLGVMGKKTDIKYHVKKEQLKSIVALQKEIISTVQEYVKPGGTMIYSTCTITKEENQDMVRYIEETFPFHLESISEYLPSALRSEDTDKGFIQLLPLGESDGFFIARFRRKED